MAQPRKSFQIKSALGDNVHLRPLLSKVAELNRIQQQFVSTIPYHLGQHCRVLDLHYGELVLGAANTAVAAKLRQMVPDILEKLQLQKCDVNEIRIKVQVVEQAPVKRPRELSNTARQALNEFKQNMQDSPLKRALEKWTKD